MSYLERLDEALEWDSDIVGVLAQDDYEPMVVVVEVLIVAARAYADLLVNGERVEWCRVHNGNPRDCEHKAIYDEMCDVVSALVDPPKEETP